MSDTSYEKKRIKELKALGFTSEETKEYMERYRKKLSKQPPIDTTNSSECSGGLIILVVLILMLILVPFIVYVKWGTVGIALLCIIPCLLIPTKKGVEDMATGAVIYTLWKNKDRIIDKADRWLDE